MQDKIDYRQLNIKRLRRILDIAVTNKVENIVLGAFKTIEFAIFCRPGFEQNYTEFCKALL